MGDSFSRNPIRVPFLNLVSHKLNSSFLRVHGAGYGFQNCGFPRTIRAQDGDNLSFLNIKADPLNRQYGTIVGLDIS